MNQKPLENARDADMRLSAAAMSRAACRAREIAVQTGTKLVISRDGVVQTLEPGQVRLDVVAAQQHEAERSQS